MSENLREVYKFELDPNSGALTDIGLPVDANILCVQTQHNKPQIWVELNPKASREAVRFWVVGTGRELPTPRTGYSLSYIGTFQLSGGHYVGHVYCEEFD